MRFVLMLIFCSAAHRTIGKSLFEFNVKPEYDLLAEESRGYSNYWPGSEFDSSSQVHNKHLARSGPHGRGEGIPGFGVPPPHPFHHPDPYNFPQPSDDFYNLPQHHFPPGHGNIHHGHHSHHGHPHDLPKRFPPPPVYNEDFINPWAMDSTTPQPFTVQSPTPAVYIAPKRTTTTAVYIAPKRTTTTAVYIAPKLTTTTAVYIAPKLTTTTTTTPAPISTTTSEDDSMYDIDVRFGRN